MISDAMDVGDVANEDQTLNIPIAAAIPASALRSLSPPRIKINFAGDINNARAEQIGRIIKEIAGNIPIEFNFDSPDS